MTLQHISDTHGAKFHTKLKLLKCDILVHSGDIGGRTSLPELLDFLIWFSVQPATYKIFVAGNHDIILDKKWPQSLKNQGKIVEALLAEQLYTEGQELLKKYPEIIYLEDTEITISNLKFYGSPITPSFHRQHWAFNADRGEEIQKYWAKIPSDVDVLITHGPPFGILDIIPEHFRQVHEDPRRGCEDLLDVMKKRLKNLQLHCFGHIHEGPTAVQRVQLTNTRWATFSNGAVISNYYELVMPNPPIINI